MQAEPVALAALLEPVGVAVGLESARNLADLSTSPAEMAPIQPPSLEVAGEGREVAPLAYAMYSTNSHPLAEAVPFPELDDASWRPSGRAAIQETVPVSNGLYGESPFPLEPAEAFAPRSEAPRILPFLEPRFQGLISSEERPFVYTAQPAPIAASAPEPQVTLPGPVLPPQLEHFDEGCVSPITYSQRGPKHGPTPAWLITLGATLTVILTCVFFTFYLLPALTAGGKHSPVIAASAPQSSLPAASGFAPAERPLGKALEVTGFRVGVDLTSKTVIQYILVNHSAADITGGNVTVTLKSTRGRFQHSPLVSFSFQLPAMGPLESREMTTVLDAPLKAGEIPDWRTLRPEVQVSQ